MTWKHADREVEQRVVIVESCWDRTKRQVDFMSRLTPIMDDDLRRVMDDMLNQLSLSLSLSINNLETVVWRDSLTRPGLLGFGSRAKKASWVWKKDALDTTVVSLEAWQRRFDPSWFLLMKIASPVVDSELARARALEGSKRTHGPATAARNPLALATNLRDMLLLSPSPLPGVEQTRLPPFLRASQMEWLDIPFSDVKAGRKLSSSNTKWYIVDTVEVGPTARVRNLARDVRVLAAKLSQADPLAFGLFNCRGVMAVPSSTPSRSPSRSVSPLVPSPHARSASSPYLDLPSSPPPRSLSPRQRDYACFQFVFRIPEGMEVLQSLRQLLLNSDAHISLSRKMRIGRELAKAINYVHTFAFVHKNVRPESVLCFEDARASRSHAFLVGFDAFRAADAGTMMAGDMSWDRNVYRHPLRQGDDPAEEYRMQHDIYSLGVCLLEIGLWESLVEYTSGDEVAGRPKSKFGKSFYHFQAWLKAKSDGTTTTFDALAFKLKDYLVEQARSRLAPRMGCKYAQVVVSCLTCLDDDNEDFGELDAGESDDVVAVHFIQSVMMNLDEISV